LINHEEGISNDDNTETFALLVLANNYNPWLFGEKRAHGADKLLTEYDHGPNIRKESIVDCILKNTKFNLERGAEELFRVHDTNDRAYKKVKKPRKD
jgi:hypothetical protein